MEYLLKNGTVVDGTGAAARPATVLIRDGKIASIGADPAAWPDAETIDCTGKIVAPGFVDVHTHSDYEVLQHRDNKILQGVTTEVVGNCGYSLYPAYPDQSQLKMAHLFDDVDLGLTSAGDYFAALDQAKPLVNVAALTGHSALRSYVIGMDRRPPSLDESTAMEQLLTRSLAEGSIGFSTGLNCLPSAFGEFDELVSLCRKLKPYNAFYTTHMRDYKFRALEAVKEAIRLAEEADVAVQLSHVQVVGQKCWSQLDPILDEIDAAASRGIDIGLDAYPYLAGACAFIQFLPEWAQDGGVPALLTRLQSPMERDRIARGTDDYMSNTWADIIVADVATQGNQALVGKSLQQVADERGGMPSHVAMDLLMEEAGSLAIISFNSRDENLRKVLSHPLCAVCSDSFIVKGLCHPRTFGTYPAFLGNFVRNKGWFSLEDAIVKTSGWPAKRFGLQNRGLLAAGYFADVVVFDAATIGSGADFKNPQASPAGIDYVFVNGELAVKQGKVTGQKCGLSLRHLQ
jgi:dihydroorotase/N-acyl-D-amino-acid deacylase